MSYSVIYMYLDLTKPMKRETESDHNYRPFARCSIDLEKLGKKILCINGRKNNDPIQVS